jgi:hypothetical protein
MRCRIRVEPGLLDCPALTHCPVLLQLLVGLIPIWKYEELCIRRFGIDLFRETGGRLHLLVTSDSSVPFIVEIVGVVIGRAVPVD